MNLQEIKNLFKDLKKNPLKTTVISLVLAIIWGGSVWGKAYLDKKGEQAALIVPELPIANNDEFQGPVAIDIQGSKHVNLQNIETKGFSTAVRARDSEDIQASNVRALK